MMNHDERKCETAGYIWASLERYQSKSKQHALPHLSPDQIKTHTYTRHIIYPKI